MSDRVHRYKSPGKGEDRDKNKNKSKNKNKNTGDSLRGPSDCAVDVFPLNLTRPRFPQQLHPIACTLLYPGPSQHPHTSSLE
jgi:hypothetical protein